MMSVLPPIVVFVPLGTAALLAGFGAHLKRFVYDAYALASAAGTLAIAVLLLRDSERHRLVHWFSGWKPHRGVAIGVDFVADKIGSATVVLIAVLAVAALLYAWRYLDTGERHFHVLMLIFEGSMIAFALSGDLFIMFVFFEVMSVASYALTGMDINESGPLEGAINFAIVNSVGSFAMLLAIGLLYGRTGALNFAQIAHGIGTGGATPLVVLSLALLLAGLLTKAAVVPFHFWLADAHAVAPTPVCVLFSGIMVELGLYESARVYWTVFAPAMSHVQHATGLVLVGGGVVSIVVGSIMSFAQQHLKRLLAFSTIAHAGIALVGIGLMTSDGIAGAALYVAGHGLVKAALFVLAGVVLHRFGSLDEEHLRRAGRGKQMWLLGGLFALGGLALAGMPPFATSLGKTAIEDAAHSYAWVPWLFGFAGALTGGAVLRATARMFLGWGPDEPDEYAAAGYAERGEEERETTEGTDHIPAVLVAPAVVLLAAALALGLAPRLAERGEIAAAQFVDTRAYTSFVLDGVDRAARVTPHPTAPIGALYGGLAAAAAIALAAAALFRTRVSESVRERMRPVLAPLHALRSAHSGHAGDYVMWFTVGLAALGGLLFAVARGPG